MFGKNLLLATGTVGVFFLLYKICTFFAIPLYPYGMLFFLIPIFGILPIYQYLEFRQLSGYKKHLIATGNFSTEQLDSLSSVEIENCWRESLKQQQ